MDAPRTPADRALVFEALIAAEPFKNRGDSVKSCRWFSIIQPSLVYDTNWNANKMLLAHWAEHARQKSPEDLEQMMEDADVVADLLRDAKTPREAMSVLKQQGENSLMVSLKLHTDTNRLHMRIVDEVLRPLFSLHSLRLRLKKTPQDALQWYIDQTSTWHSVLVSTVKHSFFDMGSMRRIGLLTSLGDVESAMDDFDKVVQEQNELAGMVFELVSFLLTRRSMFLAKRAWAYPGWPAITGDDLVWAGLELDMR